MEDRQGEGEGEGGLGVDRGWCEGRLLSEVSQKSSVRDVGATSDVSSSASSSAAAISSLLTCSVRSNARCLCAAVMSMSSAPGSASTASLVAVDSSSSVDRARTAATLSTCMPRRDETFYYPVQFARRRLPMRLCTHPDGGRRHSLRGRSRGRGRGAETVGRIGVDTVAWAGTEARVRVGGCRGSRDGGSCRGRYGGQDRGQSGGRYYPARGVQRLPSLSRNLHGGFLPGHGGPPPLAGGRRSLYRHNRMLQPTLSINLKKLH